MLQNVGHCRKKGNFPLGNRTYYLKLIVYVSVASSAKWEIGANLAGGGFLKIASMNL